MKAVTEYRVSQARQGCFNSGGCLHIFISQFTDEGRICWVWGWARGANDHQFMPVMSILDAFGEWPRGLSGAT